MMELSQLSHIGKTRLAALNACGVFTLRDLLLTLPASYRDTTNVVRIDALTPGQDACVYGTIAGAVSFSRFHGRTSVSCTLRDDSGALRVTWYNQPWLREQLKTGQTLLLYGRVYQKGKGLAMIAPTRESERALRPVYRPLGGIPPKTLRDIIAQALTQLSDCCPETLPDTLRARYRLCERNFALRQAHFPDSREALDTALHRIGFESLLMYRAALALRRGERETGARVPCGDNLIDIYWASLPFPPTGAQRRVLSQIADDLQSECAMGRMVQGDVGCGKTAVALGALFLCARAGFQGALMAPTEILARQHLQSAQRTLAPLGVTCGLLLGGMRAKERREAISHIADGSWQVVIGTHALISKDVAYHRLGLVITDEQHRFGVSQRAHLSGKAGEQAAPAPNALVMTATPIPRTLSLSMYGDLDVSVIDELPAGRKSVNTRIVPEEKREGLYRFIRSEAEKGHQTYIVCPLVEESEQEDARDAKTMYAALSQNELKGLRLGLTYGAQDEAEKEDTLARFSSGALDVLVATTVIEVGVNVPSACVMVIENADRFGLSQLHQLRGRVGRGGEQSWCFLLADENERLKTLCQTNDGFVIAQKDLELRGAGELLGTRQHGGTLLPGVATGDTRLLARTTACLAELKTPAYRGEWETVRAGAQALLDKVRRDVIMN